MLYDAGNTKQYMLKISKSNPEIYLQQPGDVSCFNVWFLSNKKNRQQQLIKSVQNLLRPNISMVTEQKL